MSRGFEVAGRFEELGVPFDRLAESEALFAVEVVVVVALVSSSFLRSS